MRRRRLPLAVVWPIALLILVGLLATLQYQWLGQVSEAERAQMQTSLRAHADDFARDFDREILRAYITLQGEAPALNAADWRTFSDHIDAWRANAKYPQLVRDIYFLREPEHRLMHFDAGARTFRASAWPADLVPVRDRLIPPVDTGYTGIDQVHMLARLSEPIVPSVPALIVTLPFVKSLTTSSMSIDIGDKRAMERAAASLMSFQIGSGSVIATLDREYIQMTVLPELAARYFPAPVDERPQSLLAHADGYRLSVVSSNDTEHPIYARGLAPNTSINPTQADADVTLMTLRTDLADQVLTRDQRSAFAFSSRGGTVPAQFSSGAPPGLAPTGKFSIVVQSDSSPGSNLAITKMKLETTQAAWHLVLQHSAGSLDAAVTQARRRSLTMSFSVLALLATSVGLIVVNAQRSQRLAAQQMDFVATVSHELRTPLAVIRSAAQNLSAGVIHDAAQAKRYGDLIDTEGKRLTDMVEQVLEFAGLAGNRRPISTRPIDAGSLVKDVLASCEALLQFEHFQVELRTAESVPPVAADEAALRRALHNLVTNAVKYGAEGRWIGITVDRAIVRGATEVLIAVSDRGQGIEAADLTHIFEPFYRGRYATERQIHGNGLGLSLVKRIAEAHGGRVTVRSVEGEGSTFTLHLPAAKADTAVASLENAQTGHA